MRLERQVNIAADGVQQVNLQKKQVKKRTKKASGTTGRARRKTAIKSKPKQLAAKSPEESIRMELGLESLLVE